MSLVPFQSVDDYTPAMREVAVSTYLEHARDWLSTAVDVTGPEQIANAKAEIATAAEATKQLNLSKEIQLDAQEMVRRAEYALGKAIRKGQAEGTVRTTADGAAIRDLGTEVTKISPKPLVGHGKNAVEVYSLSDGVGPETFDDALGEARAEGNLSRANVVRKVKQRTQPQTRDDKADLIAELARRGYSSRQMASEVGVAEARVREIARAYGIDINADKTMGRTKRHDSTQIVENTVTALEGLVMGLSLIDYSDLDPSEAAEWAASLSESIRALNAFNRKIKETAQ